MKNTTGSVSMFKTSHKDLATVVALAATLLSSAALADRSKTIAQIAAETPSLSTLVTALQKANLVDTLGAQEGKYTVLAPSNDAFAMIPSADLTALLENPEQLKSVLLYHVISGMNYMDSSRLVGEEFVRSATGFGLKFKQPAGDVYVNNAKLSSAKWDVRTEKRALRIEASNGSIYMIDRVLQPAEGALYIH
jgi:uncharacterized surface protein with fasciclin (FAS1) repeats